MPRFTDRRMDAFTQAYFDAALWSSTDNADDSGGEPLDANYGINDIDEATRAKMIADCADFQERFGDLIADDDSPDIHRHGNDEQAGHDFWLTRNGHGAGFWEDSDWPKHGKELDRAAKEYGEFDLYVGDDGVIYGSPLEPLPRMRETPRARGHRVADFNTLDDLIAHSGATALASDAHGVASKLYVPEGRGYLELRVWQKEGFWHAQNPDRGKPLDRLPREATPIVNRPSRNTPLWKRAFGASEAGGTRGGPARKYFVVDQVQDGQWVQVGHFTTKNAAEVFRQRLDGKVRTVHTFPSAHDHPAVFKRGAGAR